MDVPVICKIIAGNHLETYEKVRALESAFYPQIYQVQVEKETTIVLEEYVEGEALDTYIEAHKLSEKAIVQLMLQVCDAVKLLHSQKPAIIHRDIKPANILVDKQGKVKLIVQTMPADTATVWLDEIFAIRHVKKI